jgi:type I restriction enzyme S subunit
MVNMGELFAHDRIGDLPMDRVHLADRNPERDLLQPGDLLFARQSLVAAGAGKVSIFTGGAEPVTFESHIIRARPDRRLVSPSFLFLLFQSPRGKALIGSLVNQVSAAGIRGSDLVDLEIPLPALADQRAIASVLGTLDDKIESNRRLASKLADVSRAIVDQACDSASETTRLDEICDQIRVAGDPAHPYVGLDVMPKGSTILENWNAEDGPSGASWAFDSGDVLFGKLRPYFKKVAVAPLLGRCSREILVLRPSQPEYYGLLVATVASKAFIDYCTAISTGTKMPRAEWKDASNFEVGLPSSEVLSELAEMTRRNYARATCAIRESRTLTAIREALLPKLVSGQVRVPLSDDPEEQIAAATGRVAGTEATAESAKSDTGDQSGAKARPEQREPSRVRPY